MKFRTKGKFTIRPVHRPYRVTARFHKGERQALNTLAERTGRTPTDMLRWLVLVACRERSIPVGDPDPETRLAIVDSPQMLPRRKRKPPKPKLEDHSFAVEGGKVVAKPKAGG